MNEKIQIVFGPTASGKTEYGVNLAKKLGNAEIINADSMQVYKEIPIITNQPTIEEQKGVPHHLFGVKSILEHSDLAKWLDEAVPLINNIIKRGNIPILVGGTGMYLKSIVEGVSEIPNIPIGFKEDIRKEIEIMGIQDVYKKLCELDPLSEKLEEGDYQRISRAYEVLKFTGKSIFEWNNTANKTFFKNDSFDIYFVDRDRKEIYERINSRFEKMVENGVLDEAIEANKIFKNSGLNKRQLNNLPAYKAHGLREIIGYLDGELKLEYVVERAQQVTRNYAKRQFTWWRGWGKS